MFGALVVIVKTQTQKKLNKGGGSKLARLRMSLQSVKAAPAKRIIVKKTIVSAGLRTYSVILNIVHVKIVTITMVNSFINKCRSEDMYFIEVTSSFLIINS